jgi:hypothetical protein
MALGMVDIYDSSIENSRFVLLQIKKRKKNKRQDKDKKVYITKISEIKKKITAKQIFQGLFLYKRLDYWGLKVQRVGTLGKAIPDSRSFISYQPLLYTAALL